MEEACGVMNSDPDLMAPAIVQQKYDANADYVINEYMERLGTRLNILETELKYAWRALDLLSQEYIKMWERLEKLEGLLYEQQSVISQLLDFYTSGGGTAAQAAVASLEGKLGELEVIREILGNGTIEDGLEEGFDVTISHDQSAEIHELELDAAMDEVHIPDEAFYKSLNQAYREDLVSDDPCYRISQLGMIWEEREEGSENGEKKPMDSSVRLNDSQEIYSALDYKDYRGSSSCVSEQDIAQLTEIDAIDHLAIEKLDELDRLSNKLHQDSVNIKHLRRKLLESPIPISETEEDQLNVKNVTDLSNIDETLQKMFTDEKWSFTSDIKDKNELLMLAKSDLPSLLSNIPYSSSKSGSRFSLTDTDKEVAETLCGESRSPTSPRRKQIDLPTCNAPFTTVTGRLAYSAAVQHVEEVEAAAKAAHGSKNPFYSNSPDLGSLIAAPYEAVSCSTPSIFSVRSEKAGSPTLSICSIRTRQDGYVDMRTSPNINQNYSPPPPAPDMGAAFFPANKASSSTNVFLDTASAASSTNRNSERLSPKPHSPKSTKTSPRRNKHHSLSAAKSDSGLSSMSGWSSLEKSPGSPKTSKHNPFGETKIATSRLVSPIPVQYSSMGGRPFTESSVDSKISDIPSSLPSSFLPGGHHLSAFTTVKSPCVIDTQEGYGNFVPAPAPASDINVSPNKKKSEKTTSEDIFSGTCRYNYDQPAIYSVAGNNRDSYTTVYTGSNAEYISQSNNYPDLIEPYENNEFFNAQHRHYYTSQSYTPMLTGNTEEVQDRYKPITTRETDDLTNHEGYRTAMYRTMFPSGNITDALSYYPTSSRNENSRTSYDEQQMWLEYTDDKGCLTGPCCLEK
ncbi:hypothetical protein JTB14_006288 [Gonioctena quinquepunctata]|nr:hypothetical protein JTB14_006288 [Gonioctena quinquepunctata]